MDNLVKLTKFKNEPSVSDLKRDYTQASSDTNTQISKIDTWLDNLHVRNTAKITSSKNGSTLVPKLIRKQAEWRYASLSEPFLSTDDIFNVSPVSAEDKAAAIQNELVLNNQFNTKINKVKFIDEYIRTAVDEGTVIVKVGWVFEEEEKEVEEVITKVVPTSDPNEIQKLQQLMEMSQIDPEGFANTIPVEYQQALQITMERGIPVSVIQEPQIVTKMVTTKNQPTLSICHYKNVVIDPTCMGNLDQANFIIFSFDTSMAELEKDGRYKNLDLVNISGDAGSIGSENSLTGNTTSFSFADKPRQKLVAYEYWGYWDLEDNGILQPIVATYIGDVMIRMEINPFPDKKLPFIIAQYLPVRFSIYGEPDGELLLENQKIIGAVTRGMLDVMGRSANGQMGIRKDALDLTNKRKFINGSDYEFNAQVDPRQAFFMHTYPEIPQSAAFMLQLQNNEAESLTGVKAFHGGITGQALGNTATAVRSALDATSKRELGILRRLAEGIKQIGRKFISMNSEFLSEEEVIRITNDEFVTVKKDDLSGNFDLVLNISTAEADNQKAEELAYMLQTMGNNLDPTMSQMILHDIAKLRKMPDLAKRIKEYQPQPDPMQQQMAQLQMELLKAQIAVENAKAVEAQANSQLAQAKAQKEIATAENLSSDTDLKNLDFLEQESGTKHVRDVEKIGEQARANLETKKATHAMDIQKEMVKSNLARKEKAAEVAPTSPIF